MPQTHTFSNIEENIASLLKSCLIDLGIVYNQPIVIEIPKDKSCADLATNLAFRVSSILKKNPKETADLISSSCRDNLSKFKLDIIIQDIKAAAPGFINFYFKDIFLSNVILEVLEIDGDFGKINLGRNKKVLLEFVSANPTGPLSIAHARQAVVGDSLARILESLGFSVTKEYYNNDEGNQINILGRSLELRYKELKGERMDFPEDCYQGDYIVDLAKEIIDNNIQLTNSEDFCSFALDKITNIIKDELTDFGVKFDVWYSQKKLRESEKTNKVLGYLREKGFIYDSEGAVWFKSTEFGDDKDRVVIKSDNSYTYLAPDIAYHQDKIERGFEWLINIWGPDHHGYIPRIKAAVRALGYNKESLSVIIVQLATIYREGKLIPMSTRRGQYITLREVLDEVGLDASRFFLLMRRTDSHLEFDLELAKKQTSENPVYYVQYAYARISSILNNAKDIGFNLAGINLSLLKENEEKELLRLIFQFSYFLQLCLRQLDPYPLTVYLQELAASFHRFYDRQRVLGINEDLMLARIALIKCLKIVFGKGLDLLGVSKPEKM